MKYWLMTQLGMDVSDADLEDIPFPRAEMGIHLTLKTFQSGSLLGFVGGAIHSAYQGGRTWQTLANGGLDGARVGALAGLAVGPLINIMLCTRFDYDQFYDRAYRIRRNQIVKRADRLATFGLLAGLAGAKYCPDEQMTPLKGALAGMNSMMLVNYVGGKVFLGKVAIMPKPSAVLQ